MDEISTFEFTGIDAVEAGSYTRSHGRQPGSCQITCRPQPKFPSRTGTLSIIYGNKKLEFKDCIVDQAEITLDENGQVVSVRILDRRWKWAFPTISGRYNVFQANGNLDTTTEKKPKELATLCLEAMGETGFSVANLPDDIRPPVDWDYDNASEALESLCEACGCRIVLGLNDKVRIEPLGIGKNIPYDSTVSRGGKTADLAEVPDRLRFIGGPDIFQPDLELEAVGRDVSGERIRLLEDLSYAPAEGFSLVDIEDALDGISDTDLQHLAKSSVFRLYRIKMPADGIDVPGYPDKITDLKQLVLLPNLVATENVNGEPAPKEPIVYGVWWNEQDKAENNTTEAIKPMGVEVTTAYDKAALYPYHFSVNEQEYTVQFSQLVYKQTVDGDKLKNEPADLRLRIAVNIRDSKTRAFVYTPEDKPTAAANGTKPRVIRERSVVRTRYPEYGETFEDYTLVDNITEFKGYATEYLDNAYAEYAQNDPETLTYDWLRFDIDLDGAIQQISWSATGSTVGKTTVYRNNDVDRYMPTYQQLRYRRRLTAKANAVDAFGNLAVRAANKVRQFIFGGNK